MRSEIRSVQQQLGITTILVTHDQEEAMTVSDRVVVMNRGRVEQEASPADIYRRPASLFVAQFIGDANILHGLLQGYAPCGGRRLVVGELELAVSGEGQAPEAGPAIATVRPENVHVLLGVEPEAGQYANRIPAVVESAGFLGPSVRLQLRAASGLLIRANRHCGDTADGKSEPLPEPGQPVLLAWHAAACRLLPQP